MRNVYLIGERAGLLEKVDGLFDPQLWKVTYIGGRNSHFAKLNSFILVDKLKGHSFIESLLLNTKIIESINGFVIFGSDPEMAEVVTSKCEIQIKEKLLPIKNINEFGIINSKVGLAQLFQRLGIQSPRQFIVQSQENINASLPKLSLPVLLKGDKGGGGAFVSLIEDINEMSESKVSHISYPYVIQEKIIGDQIALEAFYWQGELTGYIYDKDVEDIALFGPSFRRVVTLPTSFDFLDSLRVIGELLQISGLVNCTFILEQDSQKHYLVEFDVRPNIWHHLAPALGMMSERLFSPAVKMQLETPLISIRVFSFIRFAQSASSRPNFMIWLQLLRTVSDESMFCIEVGSNKSLPKLNYAIRRIGRFLTFAILVQLFRKLPARAQYPFKKGRITTRVSSWILGN